METLRYFRNHATKIIGEFHTQTRMLQAIFHSGLQVSEFAAAIVALALELEGIHRFVLHQAGDAVGQLNLAAGALADLC